MATNENQLPAPPKPGAKVAERPAVTFEGLKEEFGDRAGAAKYHAIANLEGELTVPGTGEKYVGRYFFDPAVEGPTYRPPLAVATLPPDARRKVAEIINEAPVKE